MARLTLRWLGPYLPVNQAVYPAAPHIVTVDWRRVNGTQITTSPGVYIIERAAGQPAYAGRALNVRERFTGRSSVLHDLALTAANLAGYRVWVSTVAVTPRAWPRRTIWAERWLVRYLYRRDQGQPAPILQNRQLTAAFNAPPGAGTAGGLDIIWNTPPGGGLGYLTDPTAPGHVVSPVGTTRYSYPAGAVVLP
jgi:hypothetical protein